MEEWEKKVDDQPNVEKESKWLTHHSQWPNRLAQPIITLTYLLVCWYVSVNAVFKVDCKNSLILVTWIIVVAVDIALSLNTVKLQAGKSLKTRYSISLEYLKRESYHDIGMLIYAIVVQFSLLEEVDITIHLLVLVVLVTKLSQKAELLKASFTFKKYIGLINSVLILLMTSHLYVPTITI